MGTMKTKRKAAGWYEVRMNGRIYDIEQVDLGYGPEWKLCDNTLGDMSMVDRWIDTFPTLWQAKEHINRDNA